jgi:T4 RnlA family RNA ligase
MLSVDIVKKAIEGKDEFRIFERDGFIVVDYMITKADTFMHEDPELQKVLRELRGIAFSADGQRVISRPYDKFFNVGEKEETFLSNIDFTQKHVVLNKLDGSMIRTIPVGDNKFRLGTRAGITNVSMQAEKFWVRPENYERYKKFFEICDTVALSPIFEYVGPNNRIVLHYEEEDLILTAIRSKESGEYVNYSRMVDMANAANISVVGLLFDSSENLTERIAKLQGLEGAVVRFETGFQVKCKADDYVDKHRAVSQLQNEKDVLKLIFTNALDDVLPILNEDVRKQVESYRTKVVDASEMFEHNLHAKFSKIMVDVGAEGGRREFAEVVLSNERYKRDSKFLFNMLDGKEINVPDFIVSKCGSQSAVDSIRHIIGQHKLWKIGSEEE